MADLLAVLYTDILRVDPARPDWPDRDRLIVSKGHAAAGVYAILAESGFFPLDWLDSFYQDGSRLAGHVTRGVPGIEIAVEDLVEVSHNAPPGQGWASSRSRRWSTLA